jgi:hypothetical protein
MNCSYTHYFLLCPIVPLTDTYTYTLLYQVPLAIGLATYKHINTLSCVPLSHEQAKYTYTLLHWFIIWHLHTLSLYTLSKHTLLSCIPLLYSLSKYTHFLVVWSHCPNVKIYTSSLHKYVFISQATDKELSRGLTLVSKQSTTCHSSSSPTMGRYKLRSKAQTKKATRAAAHLRDEEKEN